jgi:hypothetical protein
LLLLASVLPALAALLGALAGSALGRRTTFLAATVVGTFGVLSTVALLVRLGWLDDGRRRGAAIGGLVGLGLGAPIAAMSLDRPLAVLGGAILIGLGCLVGIGKGGIR